MSGEPHMEAERPGNLDSALSSLVDQFLVSYEDEDDAASIARHEQAVRLAQGTISRQGRSRTVADTQHAADLIKKKLLNDHKSPEKALRFSNLYTRLLSQPVLSKKWETLYLLYRLAAGPSSHLDLGTPINSAYEPAQVKDDGMSPDDQTYRDAFATQTRQHQMPYKAKPKTSGTGPEPPNGRTDKSASIQRMLDSEHGPSQEQLLRDLPFTLQGLSTSLLPFDKSNTLELPPTLPIPILSLLYTLAEPALLYRSLTQFVDSSEEGLVGQSLQSAIQTELRAYLGLISSLETQIRQAVSSDMDPDDRSGRKIGVTLRRCVLWTREATMALRFMSLIAEKTKHKKGGQLISLIHSYASSHGDCFVVDFAERLLSQVTRPFYDMLRRWIYDGELLDPFNEFFVIESDAPAEANDENRKTAPSIWEEKYKLDNSMIPSIITEEFAKKIFLIGKSLNFIRHSCGDSAWVDKWCKEASRELTYGDTATLEKSIEEAYKTTMMQLTKLMNEKFHLTEHIRALKRYLLLGQGDFIALLMESLASNLDRPAGSQYRHTLTAQLEHAIRGSNAQYDPTDIVRRLDARLTEMEKGDTGWDVFTLEYKVDAPVDVVITPWANRQYLKIFNLLWRIKRVEFALGGTWRRCTTGARGVLSTVKGPLAAEWKRSRCIIAEMNHFVNQLQYYILFEVIEASWDTLESAIAKPDSTLDDLILAHGKYLRAITHKGMLGSVRTTSTGGKEDIFTSQLHQLLKDMLAYKDAVEGLYSYSVAEFTRAQTQNHANGRTPSPSRTTTPVPAKQLIDLNTDRPFVAQTTSAPTDSLPSDEDSVLPALRTRLGTLAADFKSRINTLLGDLAGQPDVHMRFLAIVMNFNDVYQPKRRRIRQGHVSAPATAGKTVAV